MVEMLRSVAYWARDGGSGDGGLKSADRSISDAPVCHKACGGDWLITSAATNIAAFALPVLSAPACLPCLSKVRRRETRCSAFGDKRYPYQTFCLRETSSFPGWLVISRLRRACLWRGALRTAKAALRRRGKTCRRRVASIPLHPSARPLPPIERWNEGVAVAR